MPKGTKGRQEMKTQHKRDKWRKRGMKLRKTKFIFGRDLSIDQIMAGVKEMAEEAGIKFVEENRKE